MISVCGKKVEIEHFPDGTQRLKCLPVEHFGKDIMFRWNYESDEELVTLFFLVCHLRERGYTGRFALRLNYIPNSRMDRVKHKEEVFTLKYFCDLINAMMFDRVIVLDPHSDVSTALLNRVVVDDIHSDLIYEAMDLIGNNDDLLLFFPDSGAAKRYGSMFPKYKYLYGNKKRRWEDGVITGTEIVNPFDVEVEGKNILIVDDICSRGTTFIKSAEALKEIGVGDIYLYVTHCENTILEGEVLTSGLIKNVFTTDSIFTKKHEKVEVFKIC